MKITLAPPGPGGRRDLTVGTQGQPGWFAWNATQHDIDDLEAVLAQDKAQSKHCGDEDTSGDGTAHTCVMPPGHWILPHICRACRHQWVTPALRARGGARARSAPPEARP